MPSCEIPKPKSAFLQTAHYRNAMGILLVYDVTNEQSFKNIEDWLKNIDKHTSQPVNKILIGDSPCKWVLAFGV